MEKPTLDINTILNQLNNVSVQDKKPLTHAQLVCVRALLKDHLNQLAEKAYRAGYEDYYAFCDHTCYDLESTFWYKCNTAGLCTRDGGTLC